MAGVVAELLRDDARLAAITAAAGLPRRQRPTPQIEPLPCVLTNMTTEDLARIRFGDDAGGGSVIVKVARSPRHSPLWDRIPAEFHDETMRQIPWRAEVDLYRSSLRSLLPAGLRMPVVYAVDELDDDRVALWMEDISEQQAPWEHSDYVLAAEGLGRLAGRLPQDLIPHDVPVVERDFRAYFFGRVQQGTLPALRDDAMWQHPLVASAVDGDLRRDLDALAMTVPALLDRLDRLPRTFAHGDACPQNLLRPIGEPDTIVAIDWTFAGIVAVGTDAGQLLAGHAESGDLDPDVILDLLEDIVDAYMTGLADEGFDGDPADARFGAVATLVVRSAFTALPVELLDSPPSDGLGILFERRARYARILVDLGLQASSPHQ